MSGPSTVCVGNVKSYSIVHLPGAEYYTWTVTGISYSVAGQSNQKDIKLKFQSSGNATITVVANNACGASPPKTRIIPVNPCSRFADEEMAGEEIVVYPNPANDLLNLKFNSEFHQSYSIRLTDITGHVVHQEIQMADEGVNNIEINIANIASGIYLLNFNLGNIENSEFVNKVFRIVKK